MYLEKKPLLLLLATKNSKDQTSRLFLNLHLCSRWTSLSLSSSSFFTKVPKTLQKRPVDHSSNVTRSRFIILKAASAPPKIKMRSPLVAEQHFNLAYVLSNPIYINPPWLLSTHNPRLTVKFLPIRVFAPLLPAYLSRSSIYIHFKRGGGGRGGSIGIAQSVTIHYL